MMSDTIERRATFSWWDFASSTVRLQRWKRRAHQHHGLSSIQKSDYIGPSHVLRKSPTTHHPDDLHYVKKPVVLSPRSAVIGDNGPLTADDLPHFMRTGRDRYTDRSRDMPVDRRTVSSSSDQHRAPCYSEIRPSSPLSVTTDNTFDLFTDPTSDLINTYQNDSDDNVFFDSRSSPMGQTGGCGERKMDRVALNDRVGLDGMKDCIDPVRISTLFTKPCKSESDNTDVTVSTSYGR